MTYKSSVGHNISYRAAEGLLFSKKKKKAQEELLKEITVKEGFERG